MEDGGKVFKSVTVKMSKTVKGKSTASTGTSESVDAEEMPEDSDKPSILPILRVAGNNVTKHMRREKAAMEKSNGRIYDNLPNIQEKKSVLN